MDTRAALIASRNLLFVHVDLRGGMDLKPGGPLVDGDCEKATIVEAVLAALAEGVGLDTDAVSRIIGAWSDSSLQS